jgi:hypothetical protein
MENFFVNISNDAIKDVKLKNIRSRMTIIQSLPKNVKQIVTDKKFVLNHRKRIDREDEKKHHLVSFFTFDYSLLSKVIKVNLFFSN